MKEEQREEEREMKEGVGEHMRNAQRMEYALCKVSRGSLNKSV